MITEENFLQIRDTWIESISKRLTSLEGLRKNILELLSVFYDHLTRSVLEEKFDILEPVILEWARARTETELISNEKSLTPVLNEILVCTVNIIRDQFEAHTALEMICLLLPVFSHAIEMVSTEETRLKMEHNVGEIEKARRVLEKLEKSKSDFISVAAHELKTPLTLIEGYISMYRDLLPEDETKKSLAQLYIKGINAGTRRLREIVDDMIDVSLIDNNLLSLNFQPVWIGHLLESIHRELKETFQQRNIRFIIQDFPGLHEMLFADGERLYQAFKNVIMNGIKFTPDGGKITIDGRLLPGFIEITIADTGIGIDPEDHVRIFEKFGQLGNVSLHSSGKTKFKGGGPGLGLPIAKGIIDAHEGTIWVESPGYDEVNCPGSTFHIMLPLRKAPPDDKSAKLFRSLLEVEKSH